MLILFKHINPKFVEFFFKDLFACLETVKSGLLIFSRAVFGWIQTMLLNDILAYLLTLS